MSDSLKLYVWHNVLTDYTSGVMFALAHSADEARKLVRKGYRPDSPVYEDSEATPTMYKSPHGFCVWGGG